MGDSPAFYNAPSRKVHRESQRDQFTCFTCTKVLSTTLLRARFTERVREISLLALLVQNCFLQGSFAPGTQRESERSVYLLFLYKSTNTDANFAHPTLLRSRYQVLRLLAMVHNQNVKY
jgi:hypothetical protein